MASPAGELTRAQNLIDGVAAPAAGGWVTKRRPADGTPLCDVARSGAAEVAAAVAAARRAQPSWAAMTPVARGDAVRRVAELMAGHADELVALVCEETGKPPKDARGELGGAVEMAYFMAGEGRRFYGRTTTSAVPNKTVMLVRAPIGVAGLLVAANTPLPNYAWKVFPALVCGNAAVLKPSEHTPLSAQRFAELVHEAGVPAGVLNVVQGVGSEAGAALVADEGVDLVSFTGGSEVGRSVASVAGARLAKVALELGGKNPLVVCDDADLEKAVTAAALSAFSNAGQRCAAGSRLIVFDAVYDEFRERLVDRSRQLRVGTDDDADLGPVVSEGQLERMLSVIDGAVEQGAKLLTGGRRLDGPGYFLEPTLLEGVAPDALLSCTELFGPVASLYRVRDLDEALAVANGSPYGLTASIHTASIHRAMQFAERVQAGMAVVNGPTYGSEPHMPFGGFKQSGNGFREAGTEALDVFSDWKNVSILHDPGLV